MELKELSKEQLELIKKPLPAEAVKPHPTKTFLSSIKAIYVTERMNEVFGVGKWTLKTEHVTTTEKSMVVVKVIFEVPIYGIYYECFGGNDNGGENSKNFDLGDAYKGATTDAITKIASYIGIGIDVFKGKNTAPQQATQQNNAPQNNAPQPEKWLNVMDKQNNYTPEWNNILKAITENKITSIADVRKYYKVSKQVEESLNQLLNK